MNGIILENIKMSLHTMKANKLRTFLSLLGVLIGVASLVVILSLGQAATKNMLAAFSTGGMDIITITPMKGRNASEIFTDSFSSTLKAEFSDIDDVIVSASTSATVRYGKETTTATIVGTYSKMPEFYSVTFSEGEPWTIDDNISSAQVCIIGSEVKESLFPYESAIDKYVKILGRNGSKSFKVVGVIDPKDATISVNFDDSIFVPYNTYTARIRKPKTVGTYVVKAKGGSDASLLSTDIENYLNSLVSTDGYDIFSLSNLREMVGKNMGTVALFIAAIGAISLLVGGIGIMNIMLVSVVERTKEIGILKALGAEPRQIETQFLLEAVILTFSGGILGVVLGIIITAIVSFAIVWPFVISVNGIFIGLLFSLIVGAFFGAYPARKASKLNPIDALNHE